MAQCAYRFVVQYVNCNMLLLLSRTGSITKKNNKEKPEFGAGVTVQFLVKKSQVAIEFLRAKLK